MNAPPLKLTLAPLSGPPAKPPRPVSRVVIVGAGFAGVAAARALRNAPAEVVLLDRRNHQIFQPLLYQVATAVLAPADVAAPIRQLTATQRNLRVEMAEVTAIDMAARSLALSTPDGRASAIDFDFLVLATGVRPSYFGHDGFATHAPGLKTLADAEAIRSKILRAYELAELTDDAEERARLMTFILVGGGPTGVELAASIAQMAKVTLRRDFRRIRPEDTRVILVEAGPQILPSFEEALAFAARRQLQRLGVQVETGAPVEQVDAEGVVVASSGRIPAATVIWTAGVASSPLAAMVGAEVDRAGRVRVGPRLNVPNDSRVFVAGDSASLTQDGRPVPGVAQAALQQGGYVGALIAEDVQGRVPPPPFHYRDKGAMAVVGKNFALLQSPSFKMAGLLSWCVWAFIHIAFLPRLQNRLRVNVQWLWSYFTAQRSSRLITDAGDERPTAASPIHSIT
jgi:NADH dehydrogenase